MNKSIRYDNISASDNNFPIHQRGQGRGAGGPAEISFLLSN